MPVFSFAGVKSVELNGQPHRAVYLGDTLLWKYQPPGLPAESTWAGHTITGVTIDDDANQLMDIHIDHDAASITAPGLVIDMWVRSLTFTDVAYRLVGHLQPMSGRITLRLPYLTFPTPPVSGETISMMFRISDHPGTQAGNWFEVVYLVP